MFCVEYIRLEVHLYSAVACFVYLVWLLLTSLPPPPLLTKYHSPNRGVYVEYRFAFMLQL